MQSSELIQIMRDPAQLGRQHIAPLQELVKNFPYFQSAHVLLALAAKKWDASVYQLSLKKTAIVAVNRSHLYDLLHRNYEARPEFESVPGTVQNNSSQEISILKSAEQHVEDEKELQREVLEEKADRNNADGKILPEKTADEQLLSEEAMKQEPEVVVALEIEKSLVNSFVEKEILKTNEAHREEIKIQQPESFGDWLTFLKKNNGQTYREIEEEVGKEKIKEAKKAEEKQSAQKILKEKKKAILDKIIETNPGVIRQKEDQKFFKSDLKAKESLLESEHLVTETLARIYAIQGNTHKAIRAYEILSLKYPQKSAYFAGLIQNLKSNLNK